LYINRDGEIVDVSLSFKDKKERVDKTIGAEE
jgi:hypothetical protein